MKNTSEEAKRILKDSYAIDALFHGLFTDPPFDCAPGRTIVDILLEGGVNDAWNNAKLGALNGSFDPAFYSGDTIGTLEAMLDYLAKKRSDKRVAYVFPHGGLFGSSENWYKTYKPAILAALKKWGVPCVDIAESTPPMGGRGISELGDKYTSDGTHPNAAGYERFYMESIAALLKRL